LSAKPENRPGERLPGTDHRKYYRCNPAKTNDVCSSSRSALFLLVGANGSIYAVPRVEPCGWALRGMGADALMADFRLLMKHYFTGVRIFPVACQSHQRFIKGYLFFIGGNHTVSTNRNKISSTNCRTV